MLHDYMISRWCGYDDIKKKRKRKSSYEKDFIFVLFYKHTPVCVLPFKYVTKYTKFDISSNKSVQVYPRTAQSHILDVTINTVDNIGNSKPTGADMTLDVGYSSDDIIRLVGQVSYILNTDSTLALLLTLRKLPTERYGNESLSSFVLQITRACIKKVGKSTSRENIMLSTDIFEGLVLFELSTFLQGLCIEVKSFRVLSATVC